MQTLSIRQIKPNYFTFLQTWKEVGRIKSARKEPDKNVRHLLKRPFFSSLMFGKYTCFANVNFSFKQRRCLWNLQPDTFVVEYLHTKKLWIYSTSWKTRIDQSIFTMDGQEICIVAASHLQRLWQTECNLGIRSVRMTCDICQLVVQYCYLVSIFCCYRSILISCERCELFISLQRSREPKCVVGGFGKFYSLWKLSSFFCIDSLKCIVQENIVRENQEVIAEFLPSAILHRIHQR